MNKKLFLISIVGLAGLIAAGVYFFSDTKGMPIPEIANKQLSQQDNYGGLKTSDNPLSIEYLRKQDYPGSDIVIEQTLTPKSNYNQYIASYRSEGLKIYALLTVPTGEKPKDGWPVIIFNHGYISPTQYKTAEKYEAYVDAFARNGYIVFKSDYRGHGNSEGTAEGGHTSPAYTIDVLNALASIKKYKDANPQKIGMWGHSMGGNITLRAMELTSDIKAGSIWAGTVGPINNSSGRSGSGGSGRHGAGRLEGQYGTPESNPKFWSEIEPLNYLKYITAPIQLQHGTADTEVNPQVSEELNNKLKASGKNVTYFTYPGDDHNLSNNLNTALNRDVAFFDKYLKNQ